MTDGSSKTVRLGDPRSDRRIYVLWMTWITAAIVVGFSTDVVRYLAERPAPPLILHLHGMVYVAWLVLVAGQIVLVERGDVRLHMRLGWATVIVAATMVPFGLMAAFVDEARRIHQADSDPNFLALEFEEMIAFSVFTVAGVVFRRKPAAHKRLMILSAVAISDAGYGRISTNLLKAAPTTPVGWWLTYFWGIALILIAMLGWDLWRRGRPHPALIAGAAFLWGAEAIASVVFFSPQWKALMTAAVRAWNWTG